MYYFATWLSQLGFLLTLFISSTLFPSTKQCHTWGYLITCCMLMLWICYYNGLRTEWVMYASTLMPCATEVFYGFSVSHFISAYINSTIFICSWLTLEMRFTGTNQHLLLLSPMLPCSVSVLILAPMRLFQGIIASLWKYSVVFFNFLAKNGLSFLVFFLSPHLPQFEIYNLNKSSINLRYHFIALPLFSMGTVEIFRDKDTTAMRLLANLIHFTASYQNSSPQMLPPPFGCEILASLTLVPIPNISLGDFLLLHWKRMSFESFYGRLILMLKVLIEIVWMHCLWRWEFYGSYPALFEHHSKAVKIWCF